jgi:trypsin
MKCINRMEKFFLQAVVVSSLMINLLVARRLGIIGGETTDISVCPYQAAYLASGKLKCGASIISEGCALTAGHCVAEYSSNISLRIGSSFKDHGGRIVEIADLIPHPKFDKIRLSYDFALMIFDQPIEFDQNIQPVELPYDFESIPEGTKCKVSKSQI